MKYLQLICIEGETGTPEAAQAMRDHVEPWVRETVRRGINLVGKPLDDPARARTVRLRDGETLISDGPFAESKEFIGGLDLLDCEDLDTAIEVAAQHPVSWFHAIELRPFADGLDVPRDLSADRLRYLMLEYVDGTAVASEPELEAVRAWRERAGDALVLGHRLQGPETATTVRVRGGETLISDGPFTATKEFIGGLALLECRDEDEALELAADFPVAPGNVIELRRFVDL